MIRFIVKGQFFCAHSGNAMEGYSTIDADFPDLEKALKSGGSGNGGYERYLLIGAEIISEPQD